MTIEPMLASEDKLDQTKLINLDMYNPFKNTLNFGTGLIVFDCLIGAHDGLLKNTSHSFRELKQLSCKSSVRIPVTAVAANLEPMACSFQEGVHAPPSLRLSVIASQ